MDDFDRLRGGRHDGQDPLEEPLHDYHPQSRAPLIAPGGLARRRSASGCGGGHRVRRRRRRPEPPQRRHRCRRRRRARPIVQRSRHRRASDPNLPGVFQATWTVRPATPGGAARRAQAGRAPRHRRPRPALRGQRRGRRARGVSRRAGARRRARGAFTVHGRQQEDGHQYPPATPGTTAWSGWSKTSNQTDPGEAVRTPEAAARGGARRARRRGHARRGHRTCHPAPAGHPGPARVGAGASRPAASTTPTSTPRSRASRPHAAPAPATGPGARRPRQGAPAAASAKPWVSHRAARPLSQSASLRAFGLRPWAFGRRATRPLSGRRPIPEPRYPEPGCRLSVPARRSGEPRRRVFW